MVLERQQHINSTSIATLFLFNTYYYGVILAGLSILGIALSQLKNTKLSNTNIAITAVGFLISGLSTFSDPLYAIEVLFPLSITLLLVFIFSELKLKRLLWIGLPPLLGGIIGYVLRIPFHYLIGQSSASHISTYDIPNTLTLFHTSLKMDLGSLSGSIEICTILAVILFSLSYSLIWIYRKTHYNSKDLDARLLILSLFSIISSVWAIIFCIITGSEVTRYLTPIVIFPLLGLIPILYLKLLKKYQKYIIIVFSLSVVAISGLGIASISNASKLVSTSTYSEPSCLAKALNYKTAYGVGSYWTVRALDLYGRPNEQALQVMSNLANFPWQDNIGAYANKKFTFIIVNKKQGSYSGSYSILPNDIYLPSNPSKITSCNTLYVYQYAIGSKGYVQLNNTIQETYHEVLRLRSSGDLSTATYL
jgi:hypothetical protein